MQLQWKASLSTTCLHAAACFYEGLPVADAELAPKLVEPAQLLTSELSKCGLAAGELLPQLVALASEVENNRLLVEQAATRAWGRGSLSESKIALVAGRIADLEAALLREIPNVVDELDLRSRPLREQWEANGPGLLHQMKLLAEDNLLAESAQVVLVAPIVGGHGRAHLAYNRVTCEAMLVNPHPKLTETLRLAWLLGQLNQDLPIHSEQIPKPRLPQLVSLATIPLVLAAAEQLDLATMDAATVASAIECWHVSAPSATASLPADVGDRLTNWWDTYTGSQPRWAVALSALDAMLGS